MSAPYGEGDVLEPYTEEGGDPGELVSAADPGTWVGVTFTPGTVVHTTYSSDKNGGAGATIALLIVEQTGVSTYKVKYVGTNKQEVHYEAGNVFNRRKFGLHKCMTGISLCEIEGSLHHSEELRYWAPFQYPGHLCSVRGRRALEDAWKGLRLVPGAATPGEVDLGGGLPDGPGGEPAFMDNLKALQAQVTGKAATPPKSILRTPRVSFAGDPPPDPSLAVKDGRLSPGTEVKQEMIEVESRSLSRARRKRRKRKQGEMLAYRAQECLHRGGLRKERKGRKRKKRKGKKSRRSNSSSTSSAYDSSSSESDRELLPPMRKKAERRPGSVLEELIERTRQLLSEQERGLGREAREEDLQQNDVKMTLFFNLFWRMRFESRPRDQKELFILCRCIDLLRSGQLDVLGDVLAGRVQALELAATTGSWNTARHLEVESLETASLARPEVLLAAQKHARLVAKSEGRSDTPKWQDWTSTSPTWDSQKGKGKGGSKSKGKKGEKGKPWYWKEEGDWKKDKKEKEKDEKKKTDGGKS